MPVDEILTIQSMGFAIVLLTLLLRPPLGLFHLRSVRVLLGTVMCNGIALGISSPGFIFFYTISRSPSGARSA